MKWVLVGQDIDRRIMQNAECKMQNAKCRMQNAKCRIEEKSN